MTRHNTPMRRQSKRVKDVSASSYPQSIPLSEIAIIRDNQVYLKFTPLRYLTEERKLQLRQSWIQNGNFGPVSKEDIEGLTPSDTATGTTPGGEGG